MNISLSTLGCKLNQAETELLARRFRNAGHIVVDSINDAEVYILNTCTVTHTADAKSRQYLRKIHRQNPNTILIATGCYAQRMPEILARIEGVALSVGNAEKMLLPEILEERGILPKPVNPSPRPPHDHSTESRTRSFIGIQDGCSHFCSYCIVPFVRRSEKSLPVDEVIQQIKDRVSSGIKEIVLTGTEIGSYNIDGIDLRQLLVRVLDETDITRLRISSLQPHEVTPELLELWEDKRLCPHFHISLQSGSDTVLRRMNRRYTSDDYKETVSLIRSHLPDVAITTDIITGFPGESDEEYHESCKVCREIGFARIHTFPFSGRPETAAASLPEQVPNSVKTQRNRNMGIVSRECAESYRKIYIGRCLDVLWEKQTGGVWSGYTGNYIRVYARSKDNLENRITQVTLGELYRDGMWGTIPDYE